MVTRRLLFSEAEGAVKSRKKPPSPGSMPPSGTTGPGQAVRVKSERRMIRWSCMVLLLLLGGEYD
jgi:hypothetical protein